nr:type VI secretion system-associated FHA domain protein TagH [uncultured Pseudomonas sp.]
MPVKLLVKSYREQPPVAELSCLIDTGGTLGRAPGNALVLEDPGKYISRSHARIERRDDGYYLIDIGSNPSVVNERLLGKGRETQLHAGDQLVIGDYGIEVSLLDAPPVDADQTGAGDTQTLAVFVPPPVVAPKPLPPLEEAPVRRSEPGFSKPEVQADALAAASILQGDSVFDPAPDLADPLGLNLFGSREPNAPNADFEALDTAPLLPAFRGAESDHLSPELQALPMTSSSQQSISEPVRMPSVSLIPDDYDALTDVMTPAGQPITFMPVSDAAPVPTLQVESIAVSAPVVESVTMPIPVPTPPKAVSEPARAVQPDQTNTAADGAVFQALLEGLGLPDLRASRCPEALARLVGEMLREATGGTMGVLMARALTKRESHIDMTMIGARSNNPLKFFPDPASALSQMLSTDAPAYLPGVQALQAAFDDLKAHELAVIAGMREALSEVVQRFEPSRIERRMTAPSAFDRWLPSGRKARLWDRLTELYSELVRDGDEDVQRIFGEKFSVAYQQQVARLRDAP